VPSAVARKRPFAPPARRKRRARGANCRC